MDLRYRAINRIIRNYLLFRAIKWIVRDYNKWKQIEFAKKERVKSTPLGGELVPYVNAVNSLEVLKLRGGELNVPALIAIYKIISILEKWLIKAIPPILYYPIKGYIEFREKHKTIKYLEDLIVIYISAATVAISVNLRKPVISFPTEDGKEQLQLRIEEVFNKLGVNEEKCDFTPSSLLEILMEPNFNIRTKFNFLNKFIKELTEASVKDSQQAYILCLIGIIYFLFIYDYNFFLLLLDHLIQLVKSGKIKGTLLKLIIRRLKARGVMIPEEIENISNYY